MSYTTFMVRCAQAGKDEPRAIYDPLLGQHVVFSSGFTVYSLDRATEYARKALPRLSPEWLEARTYEGMTLLDRYRLGRAA